MASTSEFVAVNWNSNQLIDEDSLDQINNNLNWLKNNSLTAQYQTGAGPVSTGLKLLVGKTTVEALGQGYGSKAVYFTKAFTPNTSPIVTASMYSANRVSAFNIYGLDSTPNLDHRGFCVFCQRIDNLAYDYANPVLNWMAVGY